jgi:uracil-DNA glycosylase
MASKYPSFFHLCDKWTNFFYSDEMENVIIPILNDIEEEKDYYPDENNIFRCFYMTPFDNIKVVILDKEPYCNGSATGLSFDLKLGKTINSSLQTIYKELELEGFYPVKDGNLTSWARQGVFLLNTSLTVKKNTPESHKNLWYNFSKKVIEKLSEKDYIVWVMIGDISSEWKKDIKNKNHIILEVSYTSSLKSLNTNEKQVSFIGSNIFKNINKKLTNNGLDKISW